MFIPRGEEFQHRLLQIFRIVERSPADVLGGQLRKPALDESERIEDKARMPIQLSAHLRMLLSAVIIHHQLQRNRAKAFLIQAAQEFQELPIPVPGKALPDHPSLDHLPSGKRGSGAVPLIVMCQSAAARFLQGQARLHAIQRLNLAVPIHAKYGRSLRAIQMKAYRIGQLFRKLRIARDLDALPPGGSARCCTPQAVPQKEPSPEDRATISNTRDFSIGKRLYNISRLRQMGFQTNRRLLDVEKISHDCILTDEALQQINRPRQVAERRASALRFAHPKVRRLWNALLLLSPLPRGFSNREMREHLALLLGKRPEQMSPRRMTYQLRLRLCGMTQRIAHTDRYQVTEFGLRAALFLTLTYNRLPRPGLAQVPPSLPAITGSPRRSFNQLQQEVDGCVLTVKLPA